MNGILLVKKQSSWTSQDVCAKLKRTLHLDKIGHTGTLDPFATGLLVLTINKGTKIGQFIETLDKTYVAKLSLGKATDTLDLTGKIVEEKEVPQLNKDQIKEVLSSFLGRQKQIPPKYSALKVNGKKLYEYARENIEVNIKERDIEIYNIELIDYSNNEIIFLCKVSKGTYVRTLASDIANKLNTVGHLSALTRLTVGKYHLNEAKQIEDISINDILPLTKALNFMKQIKVDDEQIKKIKNGQRFYLDSEDELIYITDKFDNPLAIYGKKEKGVYTTVRGLF